MTRIRCSGCPRYVTTQELDIYSWDWLLTGEPVYCMECRTCSDDCRQEPCNRANYLDPMYF